MATKTLIIMIKKRVFLFLTVAVLSISFYSCKTNTDDLWDSIHQLDGRVTSLEELCKQMNGNISSLQKLVQALQENVSITMVTPVKQGDKTIGYTISFTKGEPITIYHGEKGDKGEQGDKGDAGINGVDGSTPIIGVKQHTDAVYYWTLNGDWLRDQLGNMIKAVGTDGNNGEDGTTPLLEIRNGHWYLSSDDGQTWTDIGQATGDNFFSDVDTSNPNYVIFRFKDGSSLMLSREGKFGITFDKEEIAAVAGHAYEIKYKINGADKETHIEVLAQGNFKAKLKINDYTSGIISVITPATNFEENKIIVLVSDGKSRTIMHTITFVEGVILITSKSYIVEAEGGEIEVELKTNVDYIVHIPEVAKSWISLLSTTRSISTKKMIFRVSPNNGTLSKHATIQITDNLNVISDKLLITQNSPVGDVEWKVIEIKRSGEVSSHISEEEKESIVYLKISGTSLNKDDCDFIKTLPYLQALDLSEADFGHGLIPTLPTAGFKNSTIKIVTLPQNLKEIPDSLFYESQLVTIEIPEAVRYIGKSAFENCKKMTGELVFLQPGVSPYSFEISNYAFRNCTFTRLIIKANGNGGGRIYIGTKAFAQCQFHSVEFEKGGSIEFRTSCFENCDKLQGDLVIPSGVIRDYAFRGCSSLTGSLILGEEVRLEPYPSNEDASYDAFNGCLFTGNLIIPKATKAIKANAFTSCQFDVVQLHEDLEYIGQEAFKNCNIRELLIPSKVTFIGNGAFGNCINLENIYCMPLIPPTIDGYSPFPDIREKIHLYVHYGAGNRYIFSKWGSISNTIEETNFEF